MKRTTDGRFVEKRIIINKDSLKRLIYSAKEQSRLTWSGLGKKCGVSSQTIRHDWLKNKTIPLSIFKKLINLSKERKKDYLFEIITPFWGQRLAHGKPKLKEVVLPDKNATNFAEFYGILLGDGCITSDFKGFSITGDKYLDHDYYHDYLKKLIRKLFKITPKIYEEKNVRAVRCIVYSKKISQYLVDAGFPIGVKYDKQPKIPKYIFNKNKNLATCIRGIMDSDGSLASHPNVKVMIHLSITIKSLRNSVHKGLKVLGINGGIFNKGIMIYGTDKIDKFYNIIGFSNFKNAYKYEKFKKTGKVPSSKEVEMFIRGKIKN
ncbi:MAG: LAGLIDADG family homing endonuclease [Nanoarchaeota archaeon]